MNTAVPGNDRPHGLRFVSGAKRLCVAPLQTKARRIVAENEDMGLGGNCSMMRRWMDRRIGTLFIEFDSCRQRRFLSSDEVTVVEREISVSRSTCPATLYFSQVMAVANPSVCHCF